MSDEGLEKNLTIQRLLEKIEELTVGMEKMGIAEQLEMWKNPKKVIMLNFLYGITRGFGIAVGATLLAAILLFVLRKLVNLPLIGTYIAELVRIVQVQLGYY
ncbi:MAG TPA: hypothetical protein GXX38_02715 [Clostridia bacterium]|nr:hypothetical protein [Clostridia bacterium]